MLENSKRHGSRHSSESSFAGVLLFLAGLTAAWAGLSWWAERDARTQAEGRLLELGKRFDAELVDVERERDEALAQDRLKAERIRRLERQLFVTKRKELSAIEALAKSPANKAQTGTDAPCSKDERAALREDFAARQDVLGRLNRAFLAAGISWLRFFELEALEGTELSGVRLALHDKNGILEGMISAKTCRIKLDRATGYARIEFEEAWRYIDKNSYAVEKDYAIEFELEEPEVLERELGPLLTVHGAYPIARPKAKPANVFSIRDRQLWRDRLDTFFELVSTKNSRIRLQHFVSIENKGFTGIDLLTYGETGLLEKRIHAGRMEVWIDRGLDRVELRLHDGFIQGAESRTAFPKRAYRLTFAGVDTKKAGRLLSGFYTTYNSLPGKH